MTCKTLEIRDRGTFIPVLAIQMQAVNSKQAYYIHHRCGYPPDGSSIMLMCLNDGRATDDPYEWQTLRMGPRTMPVAHDYIIKNFGKLEDGDVIDVEFILGESQHLKISEREIVA